MVKKHMKKIKYPLIILFLILIYILLTYTTSPTILSNYPFSSKINVKNIESITFEKSGQKVVVVKEDKKWKIIQPYKIPANNNEIDNLLDKFSSARIFGPLTKKTDLYSKFDINISSPLSLTLKSNSQLKMTFGRATDDFGGIFALLDDGGVFEIRGIMPYDVNKDSKDLILKNLITENESEINKIEISYNKNKYILSRSDNKWVDEKSQKVFNLLKQITFMDIRSKGKKDEISPVMEIAVFSLQSNRILKVIRNNKGYNIINENDYVLLIDENNGKKIDELIKIIK